MRRFFSNPSVGFTLIELLVVIGILGIIAAGLLAVVDPIEQFRKAQDSEIQSLARQVVTTENAYAASTGRFICRSSAAVNTDARGLINCYTELSTLADMKPISATDADKIAVAIIDSAYSACFRPVSKSMKSAGNAKWVPNSSGFMAIGTAAQCPLTTANTCYVCLQ